MMVVQLGYTRESEPLFYNYLRPLTSLDERLYALACDEDFHCLATLVRSFKLIEVYIEHGVTVVDSYQRPSPRVRATIEDITDEPRCIATIEHRSEKMMVLTWHDSKEPVCDFVTPKSLPQHDSSTPCKDFVCKSITPSFVSQQATVSQVIEDVMRQLSFKETKLDGEAGFRGVAGSGIESFGLSHDESFGVDDLDLNLNEYVDLNVSQIKIQSELSMSEKPDVSRTQEPIMEYVRTQEPIVEEVRTQKPIVEEVIVEDYVSSVEDAEQGNGHEDKSASSDGHFLYDDEGINSAYETQYDVQSSKDACMDDDDEDDDFLVDEENEIVKPDVDVHLFGISMYVPFDNIGATNLVPYDVLEEEDVDVINAEGFDSNLGNDNETSNYKRKSGQKFTTTKEANDKVYMHSIESRTNLKLYKNDSVRVRARCNGKVLVFPMSRDAHDKGDLCPWVFYASENGTTTSMPEIETSISKTSKDIVEKPKTVRPSAPIIEEWDTDSDNDTVAQSQDSAVNATRQSSPGSSQLQFIWRPKGNVIDHISKDSGSYMLKRFDYVDLQAGLRLSRNNGGFVAYGGSPKGVTITGKTECLVLSPDFKLLDKSQVLLKVPRHDNMYSFDLKNVIPSVAVNTACYVQNRVLVTKPHNKTHYELLHGRPPSISFMRPFGCPVTILNTLDPLGKFDGKADEGFLVGYSINSKAFRVFNTRTRKVEENLHITFLENLTYVSGSGPDWLFDIDLLTNSMNYKPVTAGNQTNRNAFAGDAGKKITNRTCNEGEINGQRGGETSNKEGDQHVQDLRSELDKLLVQQKEDYANNTNRVSTVSPSISAIGQSFVNDLLTDPLMPDLEDTTDLLNTSIFSSAYDDEDVGAEADLDNMETTMNFPDKVYKVEKALYGLHQAPRAWYETLSTYLLENGFRRGTIDKTLFINKDKGDILLVQVYVDDIIFSKQKDDGIFISQDKYVADILKKFDFVTVKTASTPIETNKALLKR
ncbi:ribosomal RNA small subunit methyltransferase [Tanacetum coccineum]